MAQNKIKVSQSTIDSIKKLGMTKALALAGKNSKAEQGGMVAEYAEGVRRMYGERRFQAAVNKTYPTAPGASATKKAAPKTGPGRAPSSTKAPTQKTKTIGGNPLAKFVTSRVGGKSGGM